jgi:DNA-binding IclR family transcriptional regulator
LLEQFSLESPVLSLAELTRRSRLPKTSVFRVLKVAEACDLIVSTPDGYRPSLRLFELGTIARESFAFGAALNQAVERLAEQIGETVLAATVERNEMLYLAVAEPDRALRVTARAGYRRELWFGATGLVLLAALPPERRVLPSKLPRYTARTIVDRQKFERRLDQINRDGFLIERGEYIEHVAGMAVPVRWSDPAHRVAPLALVAVAPEGRVKSAPAAKQIIAILQKGAAELV